MTNDQFRAASRAYDNLSPEDLDPDSALREFKEWNEDEILTRVQAQLDRTGYLGELLFDLFRAGPDASDKELSSIFREFHSVLHREADKIARRLMSV